MLVHKVNLLCEYRRRPKPNLIVNDQPHTGIHADWQMPVSARAMPGFTERGGVERPGCGYDEAADKRSWSAMRSLFDEALA